MKPWNWSVCYNPGVRIFKLYIVERKWPIIEGITNYRFYLKSGKFVAHFESDSLLKKLNEIN